MWVAAVRSRLVIGFKSGGKTAALQIDWRRDVQSIISSTILPT